MPVKLNKLRISALWLSLAALLTANAVHADSNRSFPTSGIAALGDPYPPRQVSFPGGVRGLADVTYSTLPGYRPLSLDIYLPPDGPKPDGPKTTAKPLILFIHGGGWMTGHTRHNAALSDFPSVLAALASEGFVVASVEYRLSSEAAFPAPLQDVRAALRFMKSHAAEFDIDPTRVGIWGGSAGGHLAALTALSCGVTELDPTSKTPSPPRSECVQAAVIWYGIFDMPSALEPVKPYPKDIPPAKLLACTNVPCSADRIALASPVTYIDKDDPPFLLIHGQDDKTVPVEQSKLAYERMKAAGEPVQLTIIPGVDHSFVGKTVKETRNANLLAVNATFDFFHKTLDKKP